MSRQFMPSPTQIHWLIVIGFATLSYAGYLRFLAIENPVVGLACDAGLNTWLCLSRKVAFGFYENLVFGWVAVGAAVLNFLRPSLPLFAIALAASGLGLVLYNAGLAGLAVGILIVSFARPAGEIM